MPKQNEAYDDDVSTDEEAEFEKLMQSNDVPEPDEQDGASTDDDAGDLNANDTDLQPEEQPEGDQPDGEDGEGDDGDASGDELQEFLNKHKDKTPEEIAKLAFQQQKRANRAAYDSRQAGEKLSSVLERIAQAKQAKIDAINQQRDAFGKKLEEDPDAATREAYERNLTREQREAEAAAEAEEFNARAQAAIELASAAIPNFHERAPQIREFGMEMGFTPEEVGSIVDGRQIVTLHLAQIAGNMIKSGVIDSSGRFLQLPQAARENGDASTQRQPVQRRTQFSRQPARGAGRQVSTEQRLADVANMSDEDFANLDEAELDRLLQAAEQA